MNRIILLLCLLIVIASTAVSQEIGIAPEGQGDRYTVKDEEFFRPALWIDRASHCLSQKDQIHARYERWKAGFNVDAT